MPCSRNETASREPCPATAFRRRSVIVPRISGGWVGPLTCDLPPSGPSPAVGGTSCVPLPLFLSGWLFEGAVKIRCSASVSPGPSFPPLHLAPRLLHRRAKFPITALYMNRDLLPSCAVGNPRAGRDREQTLGVVEISPDLGRECRAFTQAVERGDIVPGLQPADPVGIRRWREDWWKALNRARRMGAVRPQGVSGTKRIHGHA